MRLEAELDKAEAGDGSATRKQMKRQMVLNRFLGTANFREPTRRG
jgi:hypothetical protein